MAAPGYTEWQFQLFNTRTRAAIDDDTGVCNVLTENSPVEVTIYSDDRGTSASNPLTMTNGVARFFTADTVTALDMSILTANGHAIFAESCVPSMHRIDIDPDRNPQKLIIPYLVVGASEAIVDTGFDIGANMLIKDIELDVITVGTGAVLDIGTSTDSDGFADGVAASTTGFPITLLEEALVSTSGLFGALLAMATGTYVRKKHWRANATSGANIVYTNTTSSSTAGHGYIYLLFDRMPTR
jgi:hypothetical protein